MSKSVNTGSVKEIFPVLEMTCAACAMSVESMLKSSAGVKSAAVNYANQSALVEYDRAVTNPEALQNTVRSIGYDLVINVEDPQAVKDEAQRKQFQQVKINTIGSGVIVMIVTTLQMLHGTIPFSNEISMVLTAFALFYFGRHFYINAWKQATHRMTNMDTLVALSTGIAFLYSSFNTFFPSFWIDKGIEAHIYFEPAAFIIAFISLGKLLEEKAKSKTTSALKKLIGLQPKTVRVLLDGVEKDIPVSEVKIDQIVIVRPGEKIPVDGVVTSGSSYVDESMISGEAFTVEKINDKKVFAGTINQNGSFQFRATKVGGETLLSQIIKMVQEAQGSKAPMQKLVDKVAGIFVPSVISLAVVTFLLWMIFGGTDAISHAIVTSITVLIIACPCALGLATPTAVMVGVGKGAENNILVRDAESLELAHRVNVVILDKTGTITRGKPSVSELWWSDAAKILKQILYSLEIQSTHPLAHALVEHLAESQVALEKYENVPGFGVKGMYNGEWYFAGTEKFLKQNEVTLDQEIITRASQFRAQAYTVMFFSNSQNVLAVAGISDQLKPGSASAIKSLKDSGIEVHMLTGDQQQIARAVAEQVGIETYVAETLPADKAEYIEDLQQKGKIVAMVGDGINDSQALAQADVSIAMGHGSDIAMDVARMTLVTSDLEYVHKAIVLSRKTMSGIKQNLFWAFVYNVVAIPIAAGVLYPVNGFLLNPMIAGAAMALSSLSVVGNSLRLKKIKI